MPTDKIESAEAFALECIRRPHYDVVLKRTRERDLRVVRAVLAHISECDDPKCSDSAAVVLAAITEGEPDADAK